MCAIRESPVGEHQANGLVENACKEIKRQVRVARSALEEKVGRPLSDSDPVLAWLPRHARWGFDEPVQERYRWQNARESKDWKAVAKACYLLRGEVVLPDGR